MLARVLSSASSPTGRPSFTHRALIFVIGGAFLFLLFRWILAPDEKLLEKLKNKKSERLQVEVYYEVLCPDSRYFILHQLFPAWERVGDIMDIRFVPYGKASHRLSGEGEGLYNFKCQHGPAECQGNMVHACATQVVQSPSTVLKYIKCMIGDNYSPLEAGQRCANTVGISWEEVEKCVEGKEGHGLLAKFGDMTHNLQPRVSFIPTIQVDGKQDGQKDMLKNFTKELCRQFKGPKPANCLEIL